jgi:hypothetical protein
MMGSVAYVKEGQLVVLGAAFALLGSDCEVLCFVGRILSAESM